MIITLHKHKNNSVTLKVSVICDGMSEWVGGASGRRENDLPPDGCEKRHLDVCCQQNEQFLLTLKRVID